VPAAVPIRLIVLMDGWMDGWMDGGGS